MYALGDTVKEDFTVVDKHNNLITGLVQGDFDIKLYNPSNTEVSSTIPVTITELGNGNYRSSFDPDVIGTWYLVVVHTTYFPWGKANNIVITEYDWDDMNEIKDEIIDAVEGSGSNIEAKVDQLLINVERILGLVQENFYIDNTEHDNWGNMLKCRIRIYDDKTKVGSDQNVIATYLMTASFNDRNLQQYKMVKL